MASPIRLRFLALAFVSYQAGVLPAGEVHIPVSVTDKDGKFITGLAANSFHLAAIVNEVVSNLRYQYMLGYRPSCAAGKGNPRTIRVNLAAPDNAEPKFTKNLKTLTVRSRTRYRLPLP